MARQNKVDMLLNLDPSQLMEMSRRDLARNVSMYIIRKLTGLSLPEIGLLFQRKHSTVKSNIDSLEKNLEYDVYLEKNIEEIMKSVRM